ncbi:MAG: elongation factor G [Burkholderiales bacterium]|nr:elongation factor G [Burkholderiales bacterium]OJX02299.1 MAG: elongation factor G [Burkholderiales bacterium 70-64]
MPVHPTENLRTLALVGHAGAGKTTLIEALLAHAGALTAAGTIERGTTVCDYDPLEKEHGHSMKVACAHFERDGARVHLLDTPGYPDFAGRALAALDAVESVAIVINAQHGIELSATRMALWAQTRGLCRFIVVNRIDAEDVDLPARLEELRAAFGQECLPVNLPAQGGRAVVDCFFAPSSSDSPTDLGSVESAHQALIEQVVEVDDALTERYLAGEPIEAAALHDAFERALREGHIVPVLFTSARTGAGVAALADFIVRLAPNPAEGNPPLFERWPAGERERAESFAATRNPGDHVLAHVFKIEIDPYVGRVGVVRVHQGTITPDTLLYVGEGRKAVRAGTPMLLQGRETRTLSAAGPGEICALTKIDELAFDAVLHDAAEDATIHLRPLPMPHAVYGLAVHVKRRGEEQKLAEVLQRLVSEDPSLAVEHDPVTHEAVIRGLGEVHVGRVLERIRSQYRLEIDAHPPTIPYRETIVGAAEGHHRHKKQSGGAGQFGEVFLRVAPLARGEGFRFIDEVKGGAIPGPFIPAVEKGVRQALAGGAVAGFPVQDVQVTVYDGKTHPVDGKEIAFITAGRKAFLDATTRAHPVVLEPIVMLEILIPQEAIGAVSGELSARRGQVSGTGNARAGMAMLNARAPLAELSDFQGRLKAITGGQGSYSLELLGYEEAPPNVQHKLRAAWRPREEE